MPNDVGTVTIEDARILWPNFEGREGKYNRQGDRNFNVEIAEPVALQMIEDGWNVKLKDPREGYEDDGSRYIIQVSVKFDKRWPPHIVMITHKGRTELDEESVEVLDWMRYKTVDLILRPFAWGPIQGQSGIKAYLKTAFFTIDEDELEIKYAEVE